MTRPTSIWGLMFAVLAAAGSAACDKHQSPTMPSDPPPPPSPVVVSVALTGNVLLTAVGETSQLTLTASLSDGSTQDVTANGRWVVGDSRVVTVTAGGLLTVAGLGRTFVTVSYASKTAFTRVTATPPGTFVVAGRVREPGQGGVLDATVTDRATGRSAVANVDGVFSLVGLTSPQARVSVARNGYEPREFDADSATDLDAPIQRVVRLTAGEAVEPPPLAPNDLSYEFDGLHCQPCRMIRIDVPTTGDMEFVLTWQSPRRLILFVEGMRITGDSGRANGFLTIPAPRELIAYVGAESSADHTKFKLTTTRPGS
jgi:hypothetical protein